MPTPSPTAALEKLCTELQADFQLLRQELYQEQQDVIARVTAMETRLMAGPPAGRRHSVWKTGSDATEVSPSSIPSRGHRSVWKTTSDRSGSPNLSDEHLRESAESVSNANQEGKLENYTLETINVETEGNGNAGNAAMDTNEEDEMTESVEVHFEESAWSIPMVLGLVDAGRFDTAYAVLLLFVNCGMQVMFSGILLSDGFMGEDFSEEAHNAQVWRTSVAHDYKYMDLAQTSLVSRVCSGDGALILSTVQATLVRQINSYLGIPRGTKDFEAPTFQPGLLLCVLCILLWSLCVYKEFRGISMCLAGAFQIPRSHKTVFKAGEFYRISFCRFALLLFTLCTRAAVACVLLFAGILWLARTTSISELMLNAVALNAILDVDEFLFLGLTPMKFQHAIQSLSPLRVAYSRRRSEWESSVQCLMLLLTMWLPFVILLRPLSATMLEVKENLCGGNQAFVIYHNPETQLTYGLNTRDQRDLGQSADLSVSEVAVQAHKFSASDDFPEYITFSATREVFEVERTQTMTQVAESFPLCLETDVLAESGRMHNDPSISSVAQLFLRSAGAALGFLGASNCSQLSSYCQDYNSRLLRYACGETCGCMESLPSPWFKVVHQGCSPICMQQAAAQLSLEPCEDVAPNHTSWQAFWKAYPSVVSGFFGNDIREVNIFASVNQSNQAMLANGCPTLRQAPVDFMTQAEWCKGLDTLFGPLAHLCPESCGCKSAFDPSYCPSSCATAP